MNEKVVGRFFAEWILQKELNGSGGAARCPYGACAI
jgi:hypothetical protein